MSQGHAQRGPLPALLDGLLHVVCQAVEAIRGAHAVDALVRSLVVVERDPVIQPLTGVREGGEHGLF